MKPLSEFSRHKLHLDGHQTHCKGCQAEEHRRWRLVNGEKANARNRAWHKKYGPARNRTVKGTARQLRYSHGYTLAASVILSGRLLDPAERCAICGIPGWLVRLNHRKGGPFFLGNSRQNTRLQPDRIDTTQPHTIENTRILCPTCNFRRGVEKYSDEEVLRWVRERWLSIFSPRMLWWMCSEPGKGGRERRNPNAH